MRDAPAYGEARTVLRGIVRLAHELGLAVCAEGVETRAEMTAALAAGCNSAQGTLLASPARPAELERWCAERGWRLASVAKGVRARRARTPVTAG